MIITRNKRQGVNRQHIYPTQSVTGCFNNSAVNLSTFHIPFSASTTSPYRSFYHSFQFQHNRNISQFYFFSGHFTGNFPDKFPTSSKTCKETSVIVGEEHRWTEQTFQLLQTFRECHEKLWRVLTNTKIFRAVQDITKDGYVHF